MINAWSLLYDEINGTLDENFPMTNKNRVTPLESDEYDPIITVGSGNTAVYNVSSDINLDDYEHSDYWYDYTRNDPDAKNPFVDELTITVPDNNRDWVYESPDGGKTVTRRKTGDDYTKKEVITGDYFDKAKPSGIEDRTTIRKYKEDESIKALQDYISTTYGGHYTSDNNNVQTLDLIESVGDAEAFCRSNAIKYLSRYDKKGQAKRDILKALHYSLLLYHFSGQLNETPTRGYETF